MNHAENSGIEGDGATVDEVGQPEVAVTIGDGDSEGSVKLLLMGTKNACSPLTDSDLLKRILVNFVSNAVQAMPNGGKLIIRGYKSDGAMIITVGDRCWNPEENKTYTLHSLVYNQVERSRIWLSRRETLNGGTGRFNNLQKQSGQRHSVHDFSSSSSERRFYLNLYNTPISNSCNLRSLFLCTRSY